VKRQRSTVAGLRRGRGKRWQGKTEGVHRRFLCFCFPELDEQINHKPGVARQVDPARSAQITKNPDPQNISARFSRANLSLPRRALRQK